MTWNLIRRWFWGSAVLCGLTLLLWSGLGGFGVCLAAPEALANPEATRLSSEPADRSPRYEVRRIHSPDGIGKFYLGREIAQVMGHEGAGWLERASRSRQEQPEKAIAALPLRPTDTVADIGAGTGYFSFRISLRVPQGKVLAVDVQPEMIEILSRLQQRLGIANVEPILGSETDPHLPASSVDLALMVDAYHEFRFPYEMMTALVRSLKPGGRVVLLEYRGENPLIPIKALHKMTEKQVKREMAAVGLSWQSSQEFLPQQHILIFQKSTAN